VKPYLDSSLSDRSNAPTPPDRLAAQPWLLIGDLLVSPFPTRASGPTDGETRAIMAMQRRLRGCQVGAWIDSRDGRLTVQQLAADVLKAKAAAYITVRLRRGVPPDAALPPVPSRTELARERRARAAATA
jgi:hypothetical protein